MKYWHTPFHTLFAERFRERLANATVRNVEDAPTALKGLPSTSVEAGEIPTMEDLGISENAISRAASDRYSIGGSLKGGENEALRKLDEFLSEARLNIGNSLKGKQGAKCESSKLPSCGIGSSFSCKISPWLATGCLSPRYVYRVLSASGRIIHNSTESYKECGKETTVLTWITSELLWRDFFRFAARKRTTCKTAKVPVASLAWKWCIGQY